MADAPPRSVEPVGQAEGLATAVLARLPDGLVVLDARGVHRELNPAFSALVGWERHELLGAGTPFPYVEDSHHEACEKLVSLALGGQTGAGDLALVHRGGRKLTASVHFSSIDSDALGGRCAVLLVSDVTEQRRIENMLRDSESRWRSVVENPFDFVCVIDRDYRYVFVNHVEPGIHMEELLGKATPLDFVEREYHAVMIAALQKAFREGVTTSYDVYSSVLDRWTQSVVGPIFEGSEVTSLCVLTRDVTSSKRAEQIVKRSQRLEMLGVIGSGLARDLRSQLEPIFGNVSLLMRELDQDSPLWPRLAETGRAAARAGELLTRLGSFERSPLEAVESVVVSDVVSEVVSRAMESLAPNVRLSVDVAAGCPPIEAVGWEVQRAIDNLCDNARRALNPDGGDILVSVSTVSLDASFAALHSMQPGTAVKVAVRDNGPGMTEEILSHVFEPFFTTWREYGGSGLGLPMVQAIAARHGGAVVARSSPADGTTVELYFPAAEGSRARSSSASVQRGKRILCVDDEAAVLKLTRRVLERAGHQVVTIAFSLDALERLESSPSEFDLVITDQIMPRLTGTELAEKILAIAPGLPVLLVSGFCDRDMITPRNVRAYLQKPVPVETLLGEVEAACKPP